MRLAFLLFIPLIAAAQIEAPRLGVVIDSHGRMRGVHGIPGALTLGAPESEEGAVSAGASSTCTAWKTTDKLLLQCAGRDREAIDAPAGPALFAFRADGALAAVYFPSSSELRSYPSGETRYIPGGVSLSAGHLLIEHDGTLSKYDLMTGTGAGMPGAKMPAVLLEDGSVLEAGALSQPVQRMERFAPGLVLLDGARLLRVRDTAVFELPGEDAWR
jgi:hypothetical protein